MFTQKSKIFIAEASFPLTTVQMLTNKHIIVGGGTGSESKESNGFEIFKLTYDGKNFIADLLTRHQTFSINNFASFFDSERTWLVANQDYHCQLYNVAPKISPIKLDGIIYNQSQVILEPVIDQTDFSKLKLQKIVKVSPCCKLIATGGFDGIVRIWKFPKLIEIHDIKAHTQEIDDIDFNKSTNLLATVAGNSKVIIWEVISGQKIRELPWNSSKLSFNGIRFHKKNLTKLFTVLSTSSSEFASCLVLWDVERNSKIESAYFKEQSSAIAVSDDGKYAAVGTISGSVGIYDAENLQKVFYVSRAHSSFVTSLEFLRTELEGPEIKINSQAAVLSVSGDRRIFIHQVPFKYFQWSSIIYWGVLLFVIFFFLRVFI